MHKGRPAQVVFTSGFVTPDRRSDGTQQEFTKGEVNDDAYRSVYNSGVFYGACTSIRITAASAATSTARGFAALPGQIATDF